MKEFGFRGGWILGCGAGGDGGTERVAEGIATAREGTGVRDVLEELLTATGIDGVTVSVRDM